MGWACTPYLFWQAGDKPLRDWKGPDIPTPQRPACSFYIFSEVIMPEETYLCPVCDNKLVHGFCTACMRSFSEEIASNSKLCLTGAQIQKQDLVDNVCFDVIKGFYPDATWDQEYILIRRLLAFAESWDTRSQIPKKPLNNFLVFLI